MKALTYVAMIEGVMYPVVSFHGSWSSDGFGDEYQLYLPGDQATERILPSTHVHLWAIETDRTAFRRSVQRIDRDNLHDEVLWYDQSIKTIGEMKPVYLKDEVDELRPRTLVGSMPMHGFMYRGGGEIMKVSHGKTAMSPNTVILTIGGYSQLLERIQSVQALRGAGALSDVERRRYGQEENPFPGKGRRAYAKGVLDLLTQSDNNLTLGVRQLINRYSLTVNPMWRTRIPMARIPNQIVGLDDDTSAARLLKGEDFRKYIRDALSSQQTLGLGMVAKFLLQLVGYRAVAIPSPAYFPLAPTDKMIQVGTRELEPERIENYYVRPSIEVMVPETTVFIWEGGSPPSRAGNITWGPWTGRESGATSEMAQRIGTWRSKPFQDASAPVETLQVVQRNLLGGKIQGQYRVNRDRSVTVTFSVPARWTGGPATYTDVVNHTAIIRTASHPSTEGYPQPPGRPLYDGTEDLLQDYELPREGGMDVTPMQNFPLQETIRENYSIQVQLPDRSGLLPGKTINFAIRFRAGGPRTRRIAAVTEPIMQPEGGDLLPNWVSRLNTYAILPHLWWALFPACNVVIPEDIRNFERSGPPITRITRLIAKIPPGRSGHRTTFVNTFPAPTEADLNKALEDSSSTYDPGKLMSFEYSSGVIPEIWYIDTLSRAMRNKEWETFMKSRVTSEFWSRRLAPSTASLVIAQDVSIVPGAPLLVIVSAQGNYTGLTPYQRSLLKRLKALRALKKRLKKCRRSRPRPDALLRHLICVWNCKKGIAYATKSSWAGASSTGDLIALTAFPNLRANINKALEAASVSWDTFWQSAGGKKFGSGFVYHTSATRWGVPNALASLGRTQETLIADGVDFAAFQGLFTADTVVRASDSLLNQLIGMLRDGSNAYADIDRCNAAVSRDIARVDKAIEEVMRLLRESGASSGESEAYIGYVEAVGEQVSGEGMSETMSVTLSHVRKVGEDLDFDGLTGDDVENTVTFGDNGYMDERYHKSKIGEHVYLPIFGCKSGLEIPGVVEKLKEKAEEDTTTGEVGGLPDDASDIIAQMEHHDICPGDCTEGDGDDLTEGITEFDVAQAIIDIYSELKGDQDAGAVRSQFKEWKSRLYMNIAEGYIGQKVSWSADEGSLEIQGQEQLAEEFPLVYDGGDPPIRGFFATSFAGPDSAEDDLERLRPRKLGSEKEDPKLVDEEKSLLKDRAERAVDALRSIEEKTYGG